MHVLQATCSVIRYYNAQILGVLFVPDTRHIGNAAIARNYFLFHIVPDLHMKVISKLIGFRPDKRRLYFVNGPIEMLQVNTS